MSRRRIVGASREPTWCFGKVTPAYRNWPPRSVASVRLSAAGWTKSPDVGAFEEGTSRVPYTTAVNVAPAATRTDFPRSPPNHFLAPSDMGRMRMSNQERTHLDIHDRSSRENTAKLFGVTDEQLRKAVRLVGSRVSTLRGHFKR